MARPYVLDSVHAKALLAPRRTVRGQRATAAQVVAPHLLELQPVDRQHLLDAHALLDLTEIYPRAHACPPALARSWTGWPLLPPPIKSAPSLRAPASIARLRFPRCSSRSCTAASHVSNS